MVYSVRLDLPAVDPHQVDDRSGSVRLHRLVDGPHQEEAEQGLRLEVQALVLRQKEDVLLPRVPLQLQRLIRKERRKTMKRTIKTVLGLTAAVGAVVAIVKILKNRK